MTLFLPSHLRSLCSEFVNSFARCRHLFEIVAKSINIDLNILSRSWTWVGSIHGSGWVESGWIGLDHKILRVGWIGLGRVQCQKISNKYTIYTQETDGSTAIINTDEKL